MHRWLIVLSLLAFLHCQSKGQLFLKSLLQRKLFTFQLLLIPEDTNCKPVGLDIVTLLFWRAVL